VLPSPSPSSVSTNNQQGHRINHHHTHHQHHRILPIRRIISSPLTPLPIHPYLHKSRTSIPASAQQLSTHPTLYPSNPIHLTPPIHPTPPPIPPHRPITPAPAPPTPLAPVTITTPGWRGTSPCGGRGRACACPDCACRVRQRGWSAGVGVVGGMGVAMGVALERAA
jgi:hypothetical protein